MKAVILAGGRGTRLAEETQVKPKPLVEASGQPLIWHIMQNYGKHGITDFVVLVGYKGQYIREYFANFWLHQADMTFDLSTPDRKIHKIRSLPWKVSVIDTGIDTNTGGRIALKVSLGDEISVGSKETARRFIFIDDLIAGILQSASKGPDLLDTKILNLAGSELVSLDQIVSAANEILGKSSVIVDGGKIASIRNPLIDETSTILEWSPKINIRQGLESCLKVMSANIG